MIFMKYRSGERVQRIVYSVGRLALRMTYRRKQPPLLGERPRIEK